MAKKKPKISVRQFHTLGQRLLKAAAKRKQRGEGVWYLLDEFGANTTTQKNRIQEARHFARLYDDQQLAWLCSLGHDVGQPLKRLHVVQLIRVADGRRRNGLAVRCAKEAWSVRRLESEVRKIGPRRRFGGARPKPPQSPQEAWLVSERLAGSWIRWVSVLEPMQDDINKKGKLCNKESERIWKKLRIIKKTAVALCADIEACLKKIT